LDRRGGSVDVRHFAARGTEGLVVSKENLVDAPLIVRVQSSCVFSEAIEAIDCDCASQLHASLDLIGAGGGIVIYTYEEGRGAGLRNKIEAVKLQQDHGYDTARAFARLGFLPDPRSYEAAAAILHSLLRPSQEVKLLTNNPSKTEALIRAGINIIDVIPLVIRSNETVARYLAEKARVLGHVIEDA